MNSGVTHNPSGKSEHTHPPEGSPIPSNLVNHLHHGRIETVLEQLPVDSIDCIFADPDYNIGVNYAGKSYKIKDKDYLEWSIAWAKECEAVLKPDGNLFIINYPRNNALLWAECLDDLFARVNEYVWVYRSNLGVGKRQFTTAHRSILHCTKSRKNRFYRDAVAEPYRNPTDRRVSKLIKDGSPGRMPYSWLASNPPEFTATTAGLSWIKGIELEKNVNRSKSFHSCQIPERLSRLLFRATTKPGDTVLVLFGGAGSELVVCEQLKLNWISAELVDAYCALIEERLKNGGIVPKKYRMTIPHRKAKPVVKPVEAYC
ncbi:MAG: site-specific DNA-methyltransferase [Thermoplasmatales archaeon]|nr:site-specific DNA-methyltransferase [Thermoplasmatales archaeon]